MPHASALPAPVSPTPADAPATASVPSAPYPPPPRPLPAGWPWIGRLAGSASFVSLVLVCLGDPMGLALPGAILGVAAGIAAARRLPNHAAGLLGITLGILAIVAWVLVIVVLRQGFGLELTYRLDHS
jgi:hypothetical protein